MGSTAPSVAGLRNLLECQLVASGPVSASPSPTTQATIRLGLSNAAPYACTKRVAEFAAFVDGAGCLRRDVAGNAVGPAELAEEALDAVAILLDVRIDLGVGAFEIGVRHQARDRRDRDR